MLLNELVARLEKIRKGTIRRVTYVTTNGDYSKVTTTYVRFVNYAHINGVQPKGKANANENHYLKDMIIYNSNTKRFYLQMATIKTNNQPTIVYYNGNNPITKSEYEMAVPPRPRTQPLVVFRKGIEDIISID